MKRFIMFYRKDYDGNEGIVIRLFSAKDIHRADDAAVEYLVKIGVLKNDGIDNNFSDEDIRRYHRVTVVPFSGELNITDAAIGGKGEILNIFQAPPDETRELTADEPADPFIT